jgi:hypothetical protein
LRDPRRKLTAPTAAPVRGRILRVESVHANPPQVVLVLRPEAVQVGDIWIPVSAVRDVSASGKKIPIDLPDPGEEHSGRFRFAGDRVVVPPDFRSDWRTVE